MRFIQAQVLVNIYEIISVVKRCKKILGKTKEISGPLNKKFV